MIFSAANKLSAAISLAIHGSCRIEAISGERHEFFSEIERYAVEFMVGAHGKA